MAGMNLLYIPPLPAFFQGQVHPGTKELTDFIQQKKANVIYCGVKNAQYEAWKKEGMFTLECICDVDDPKDPAGVIAEAVARDGLRVDAVFSRTEQYQPLVGQLCELLGIPNNPASAYSICRNKHASRVALRECGLPTPKSCQVQSVEEIDRVLKEVPFPVVVKPTAGAGSMGVFRADNEADLRKYITMVFEEIAKSEILSTNPGVENEAPCMVEQFLLPKQFGDLPVGEFDVDILLWEGKMVYGRVCDNWLPSPPYFLENGSNFPSVVPQRVQDELATFSYAAVRAMGFVRGAFHVECIYTEDGAQLIEVNPRVGGGPDEHFHLSVTGVHMTHNFLLSMMNIPINPPRKEDQKTVVHYDVCCPVTGTLADTNFLQPAKDHPFCVKTENYVKEGTEVVGFDTQIPQWLGAMFFEASAEKAADAVRQMNETGAKVMASVNVTKKAIPPRRGSRKASVQLDLADLPQASSN